MKRIVFLFTLLVLSTFQCVQGQERILQTIDQAWVFKKGSTPEAMNVDFDDSSWEKVAVPHDWAIGEPFIKDGRGSTGKLPWKAEGWYRNQLMISKALEGKKLVLIFDGVMAFPKIYVNGTLVGSWDYGYNAFYIDITSVVKFGQKNTIAVYADTREHDSRWYPGGGLYRKVQLLATNPIHVKLWETQVTTPIIKDTYAEVRINATVENATENAQELTVTHTLFDANNIKIASQEHTKSVASHRTSDFENTIQVMYPQLWDVNNPYRYRAETTISQNGIIIDCYTTPFGIRSIRFTAHDGFYLNNKRVQLKGVNLHSDHGPLGVAFNYRAMERQLEIMKAMGVNAIRNSHNVAAPELLELCDTMGLLFFNEIFDKYDGKADLTATTDFDEFAHRNIKNFVLRGRNHPSVFLWSVGNEIGDVQWNINSGFKRLHTMLNYVRKYDHTRPTTLVNDNLASARLRHFDLYDVHSWNYGRRYRLARELEPNKSVIISESASTLSTRGFYEFPLPKEKTAFTKSLQVSSYDLNAPSWAEIADDDFMWQQQEKHVAGEFVWTGFDYLGEPTPYDNRTVKKMGMTDVEASRSSYFGIVDLVGIPKDRFYLYKSYWKPEENTIHLLPHWNWRGKEGDTIPVFAYTNGDCGELFVNGVSQGMQCKKPTSLQSTERFRLMWKNVLYTPGTIKVVAYKNQKKIGENSISTTGKPYSLKLTVDQTTIAADGKDLSYVLVEAFDKEGRPHPLADDRVHFSLDGVGEIAGVGNGNPQSFEPFQSNTVRLFYGKAMLIVKSTTKKGTIKILAQAKKLKQDRVEIRVE